MICPHPGFEKHFHFTLYTAVCQEHGAAAERQKPNIARKEVVSGLLVIIVRYMMLFLFLGFGSLD